MGQDFIFSIIDFIMKKVYNCICIYYPFFSHNERIVKIYCVMNGEFML